MKNRKLITTEAYVRIAAKLKVGVPMTRIIRDFDLDISRPALIKLVKLHSADDYYESLYPKWLDQAGPMVQEQPKSWSYVGYFPQGVWLEDDTTIY